MASGAMNALGGAAGPFASLYAVNSGWPPRLRVATLQAYFAVLNVAVLATLGLPRHLAVVAAAGPAWPQAHSPAAHWPNDYRNPAPASWSCSWPLPAGSPSLPRP